MKRISKYFCLLLLCLAFTGCSSKESETSENDKQTVGSTSENTYEQINQIQAKEIMDSGEPYILLDVRSQEEYVDGHIKGAILIPDHKISEQAEQQLPDKDALILVYCRSGRRSKKAAGELASLGYTNVKEFGGIIDWAYGIER